MARYIALLRAINVGGTGKLKMKDLSQTLRTAGYKNVQTLLASGNILLDTAKTPAARLASTLEKLLAEKHQLATDIMVCTPEEWAAMIDANPMSEAAESSPSAFGVMVMKGKLDSDSISSFIQTWEGPEQIRADERFLYIYYPNGMGESKLKLPTTLGIGTVRNWNTVRKLSALSVI